MDGFYYCGDNISQISSIFYNFELGLQELQAARNQRLEKLSGFDAGNTDSDSEAFDFALKEYEDASTSYSVYCRSFAEFVLANRDHIEIK